MKAANDAGFSQKKVLAVPIDLSLLVKYCINVLRCGNHSEEEKMTI